MKLSVSLPNEDVEFIDAYAKAQGIRSRSSALRRAVAMLRAAELAGAYSEAFEEWEASGEAQVWDAVAADAP